MALWGTVDTLAATPAVYTKTTSFDATDASVVVLASNTIKLPGHSYLTGDAVVYNDNGGTVITGLTDAATVFVNRVDADTIKLYTTKVNAVTGHASTGLKALTGVGVGAGHNFVKVPDDQYFIDTTEASLSTNRVKGLKTPGWNTYSTKAVPATVLSFDSTAVGVSLADNVISVGNQTVLINGSAVTYSRGGQTIVTGLTDGAVAYVHNVGPGMIKLYGTSAQAITGGATGLKALTVVGVGTHTLTAADGVTRNMIENIVPMKVSAATAGDVGVDGTDDALLFDRQVAITTQPLQSAATVDLANDANIVLAVVATALPGNTGLAYQWQEDGSNISASGIYTNVTTATMTITGTTNNLAGKKYRCVVSATAAQDLTSSEVVATQSA